jgi:YgiT-type zinc finger domain-containing protein
MRCLVCGGELALRNTDLPFKVSDTSIVILKDLPVLQCGTCPEYLLEDQVLTQVNQLLARVDSAAELEIIRYGA